LVGAGEVFYLGVPGRQAQRVGGEFQLMLGIGTRGGNNGLQSPLFLGQLVEVGIRLGIGGVDFFELLLGLHHGAHARFDFLAHGLLGIELRFLRQVADGDIRQMLHLAVVFLVDAGHDLQYGGLARAIEAQEADLGAREEGQRDVLDDLTLRGNDLAHAEHRHDVLSHF